MSSPNPRRKTPSLAITRTMLWVLILGYAVFLVAGSTYENYRMNEAIDTAKQQISELEKKNRLLRLSLTYYQSDDYREMEARRRLGLKGSGEHVVALPDADTEPSLTVVSSVPVSPNHASTQILSPPKAWWNFFFGS